MRGKLNTAAKVVVSVGLLAYLLHKAGLSKIGHALEHANLTWMAAAVVLGFAATCMQATQWHALLHASGLRRTWWRCLRLVFVGNTFNSILPSSIGGDVVRAVMAADAPAERVPAATTVVLQRLCNFPGMMILMAVGLVATLGDSRATEIRGVALAGLIIGAFGLALCMTPLLGRIAAMPLLQKRRPGRILSRLLGALDEFRDRRGVLLAASARGTAFWGLSVVNQYAFMHAVGVPISLAYAAIVVTTINALTMLPISINGYGVREGSFTRFLGPISGSAAAAQGVATGFLLDAQSLLWAGIGVIFFLTDKRHREAAAAARAAAPAPAPAAAATAQPEQVPQRIAS